MNASNTLVASAAKEAVRECVFLDARLRPQADNHTAAELRVMANTFDDWAAQSRFKADLMDGRMFKVTHWIGN